MYLLLIALLLLNSVASNNAVLLKYRIFIAGVPINPLDILTILGVALIVLPFPRNRLETRRVHPLLWPTLALFVAASVAGILASVVSDDVDPYYFFTTLRNFLMVPAAVALGYWLIHQPRQLRWYTFFYTIAGVATALMILLFFTEKGEEVRRHDFDINMLRSMEYCSPVAGIVASFLIYQLASGVRRLPMILAALLAGFCASGQAATLSRSDWIALSGCILSIFFLLPRERRMMRSIRFALVLPTLLVFLLGAVYAAARVTHTDFAQRIQQRIDSMLPTERQTSKEVKAWDSRLGSTIREIELWAHSPLLGNGFGHRYIYSENGEPMPGYGHNSWSFTLYQTGPLGLAAMVVVCVGSWIVGRRVIRDANGDLTWTLVGALAPLSASFYLFHGLTTASFNVARGAIMFGMSFGVILRARMMQLEVLRQQNQLEAYWAEHGYLEEEPYMSEPAMEEPIFGNWYQPN